MFGCHLNKKEVTDPHSGTGESNKGPVWKLRKWTKDGGYKTVVGGGGGTPSELCTRDMRSNANTLEEEITKNEEDEVYIHMYMYMYVYIHVQRICTVCVVYMYVYSIYVYYYYAIHAIMLH